MPITLPPINRRKFLAAALASGAGLLLPRPLFALEAAANPNYFALISDLHLHADRDFVYTQKTVPPNNMWANFRQAADGVVALPERPAAVLINGDVAFHEGLPGDYATALAAMKPLREAGLPVHWALGNHDDRANVAKLAEPDAALVPELGDRRVMTLQTPLANIFVMDSLNETNHTPGLLGKEQLGWLEAALDRHADRPAIVFVHHQPCFPKHTSGAGGEDLPADSEIQVPVPSPDGALPKTSALMDTAQLLQVLLPRKHVKIWLFGHTHHYSHRIVQGMHLVNLPATGYPFVKGQPLGWMDMRIESAGAKLQLHCLDPKHPLQGDKLDLKWRV